MGCSSQGRSGQLQVAASLPKTQSQTLALLSSRLTTWQWQNLLSLATHTRSREKVRCFLSCPETTPGTAVGSGTGSNAVSTPYSMLAGISAQLPQPAPAPPTTWALHKGAAAVLLCGQNHAVLATEHPLRLPAEKDSVQAGSQGHGMHHAQ